MPGGDPVRDPRGPRGGGSGGGGGSSEDKSRVSGLVILGILVMVALFLALFFGG